MVTTYEIEIPSQIIHALGLLEREVAHTIKKELAIHYFHRNVLSFGQARQLSGLGVWDFLELLRERQIPLHYSEAEYAEDSEVVEKLLK